MANYELITIYISFLYMRNRVKIGDKFNLLTVKEVVKDIDRGIYKYLCDCECGKERLVGRLVHLERGVVKSCGCKNFSAPAKNRRYDSVTASYRAKASSYKANAKQRDIEYTIDVETTIELLKGDCYYCGDKPQQQYNVRAMNRTNRNYRPDFTFENSPEYTVLYNGIDRVNNDLGYIPNNVVSCCSKCNTAKLTQDLDEFKDWIIKVYNKIIK